MPITLQDIREHQDYHGIGNVADMTIIEYRQALENEVFFWIDHHDFVRSTLSGEIFATNREQLDVLIQHLQGYRNRMQ